MQLLYRNENSRLNFLFSISFFVHANKLRTPFLSLSRASNPPRSSVINLWATCPPVLCGCPPLLLAWRDGPIAFFYHGDRTGVATVTPGTSLMHTLYGGEAPCITIQDIKLEMVMKVLHSLNLEPSWDRTCATWCVSNHYAGALLS